MASDDHLRELEVVTVVDVRPDGVTVERERGEGLEALIDLYYAAPRREARKPVPGDDNQANPPTWTGVGPSPSSSVGGRPET